MKSQKVSLRLLAGKFISILFISAFLSCNNKVSLQLQLDDAVKDFHGQVGIYVYSPGKDLTAGINEDTIFPTASMIKVPILCTLWEQVAMGKINPDSIIYFTPDSIHYPWKGEDALGRFAAGEDISVRHLMTHMITFSDNHASLYLQHMAGTGTAVNNWLESNNFKYTRVNSRTEGRDSIYARYGWGQTTPREMTGLLLLIREGKIISPAVSEAIYRHLTRIYWNGEALSQIPPTIQAASKQGAVDESRSEVVLVNAPHGDYAFCIITNHQQDTSWAKSNEGYRLIRKVSALLWKYFEPGFPYVPPEGIEKYLP
jgi:beta-lactamase class A